MAEQNDRIQGVLDAVYAHLDQADKNMIRRKKELVHSESPVTDPPGTVRREHHGGDQFTLWVLCHVARWSPVTGRSDAYEWRCYESTAFGNLGATFPAGSGVIEKFPIAGGVVFTMPKGEDK